MFGMRWSKSMSNKIDVSCVDMLFVREWYTFVPRPRTGLNLKWRDDEEFPHLQECLVGPNNMPDCFLPSQAFGGVGEAIPILSNEQVLFFLPYMLQALASPEYSEESVYYEAVVDAFLRIGEDDSLWPTVKSHLDKSKLSCITQILTAACKMCWTEEPEGSLNQRIAIAKIFEMTA
jgi:hypothetical protein